MDVSPHATPTSDIGVQPQFQHQQQFVPAAQDCSHSQHHQVKMSMDSLMRLPEPNGGRFSPAALCRGDTLSALRLPPRQPNLYTVGPGLHWQSSGLTAAQATPSISAPGNVTLLPINSNNAIANNAKNNNESDINSESDDDETSDEDNSNKSPTTAPLADMSNRAQDSRIFWRTVSGGDVPTGPSVPSSESQPHQQSAPAAGVVGTEALPPPSQPPQQRQQHQSQQPLQQVITPHTALPYSSSAGTTGFTQDSHQRNPDRPRTFLPAPIPQEPTSIYPSYPQQSSYSFDIRNYHHPPQRPASYMEPSQQALGSSTWELPHISSFGRSDMLYNNNNPLSSYMEPVFSSGFPSQALPPLSTPPQPNNFTSSQAPHTGLPPHSRPSSFMSSSRLSLDMPPFGQHVPREPDHFDYMPPALRTEYNNLATTANRQTNPSSQPSGSATTIPSSGFYFGGPPSSSAATYSAHSMSFIRRNSIVRSRDLVNVSDRHTAEMNLEASHMENLLPSWDIAPRSRQSRMVPTRKRLSKLTMSLLEKVDPVTLSGDDKACCICYNDYGVANGDGVIEYPVRIPKCKHTFGNECIKIWFDQQDTCPYCREKVYTAAERPHHHVLRSNPFLVHSHYEEAIRHLRADSSGASISSSMLQPGITSGSSELLRRSPIDDGDSTRRRTRARRNSSQRLALSGSRLSQPLPITMASSSLSTSASAAGFARAGGHYHHRSRGSTGGLLGGPSATPSHVRHTRVVTESTTIHSQQDSTMGMGGFYGTGMALGGPHSPATQQFFGSGIPEAMLAMPGAEDDEMSEPEFRDTRRRRYRRQPTPFLR